MKGLYMKKSLVALLALTSMLGFSAYAEDIAFDAVFYVSSARGNDANDGSSNAPFATVGKAVGSAVAGKTKIWIEDGTYAIASRIDLNVKGKEVYIEGVSKDASKVILSRKGRIIHNENVYCEVKYVTFTSQGQNIDDVNDRSVLIKDGHIVSCIFTNIKNALGAPAVFMTRNAVLENCLFYGNSGNIRYGQVFCTDDGGTATGSPAVVNCTFYDDSGCGGVSMAWANGRVINCVEKTGGVMATGGGSPVAACYLNCAGDFIRDGAVNWLRVDADPFVDSAANVFSVYNDSLLADAGDTSLYREVAVSATDLANNPRFTAGETETMNIGAYEWPTAEKLAAYVRGGTFEQDDKAHSCQLFFGYPRDGNGCQVDWAWSDDDGFSHMEPSANVEPGVYTNIARVTLSGYEPYYGTGVVTVVAASNYFHVSPDGDDAASGTIAAPLKTISAAVSKAVEFLRENPSFPLAKIMLSEGTYAVGSTISISAASGRIDFIGQEDDPSKVVLVGSGRIFSNDGTYCEIKNLTLTSHGADIKNRAILIKDGRVSNCIFTGLKTTTDAPAVFMTRNAILENCLFYGNSGKAGYGQVFCIPDGNITGSPAVVNCTFYDDSGCGGVSMSWANGRVINCVEKTGGVIANCGTAPVASCYVNCAGDFVRLNAVDWITLAEDPFVDAANGDFRIGNEGVPLMQTGDLSLYLSYAKSSTDLAGSPRFSSKGISVGAYEVKEEEEGLVASVSGGLFYPDGANHPCRLNFITPSDGAGCTVVWAWTDNGPFEHSTPSANRGVGIYTNVVRITKEACDTFCATAVVEVAKCPQIYVATDGVAGARGTRENPLPSIEAGVQALDEFFQQAPTTARAQILVGDGEYLLTDSIATKNQIDILGASKDPTKVVLRTNGRQVIRNDGPYCEFKYLTLSSDGDRAMTLKDGRVSNCIFTGCHAKGLLARGVVLLTRNGIVENCLFYGNTSEVAGNGQVYCIADGNVSGSPAVVNCTFHDDSGLGGVAMSWANGRVINCLEITGGVVANCGTDPVASCYQNCAGDFDRAGATGWIETTVAEALPNLSKSSNKWCPGAPLVNMGNTELYLEHATSTVDLQGRKRKCGADIDIGCSEKQLGILILFK